MRYAQYYTESIIEPGKLVPACGCDAVKLMDGRRRVSRCLEDSASEPIVKRKGYVAVQIFEGTRYTNSKALTDIVQLTDIIL